MKVFEGAPPEQKNDDELFEEYVENGGGYCPHCGHLVLGYDDLEFDGREYNKVKRTVHCDKCHKDWVEEFTLTEAY